MWRSCQDNRQEERKQNHENRRSSLLASATPFVAESLSFLTWDSVQSLGRMQLKKEPCNSPRWKLVIRFPEDIDRMWGCGTAWDLLENEHEWHTTYCRDSTFQRKLDWKKQTTASLEPDGSPYSEEWGGGQRQLKKKWRHRRREVSVTYVSHLHLLRISKSMTIT